MRSFPRRKVWLEIQTDRPQCDPMRAPVLPSELKNIGMIKNVAKSIGTKIS